MGIFYSRNQPTHKQQQVQQQDPFADFPMDLERIILSYSFPTQQFDTVLKELTLVLKRREKTLEFVLDRADAFDEILADSDSNTYLVLMFESAKLRNVYQNLLNKHRVRTPFQSSNNSGLYGLVIHAPWYNINMGDQD